MKSSDNVIYIHLYFKAVNKRENRIIIIKKKKHSQVRQKKVKEKETNVEFRESVNVTSRRDSVFGIITTVRIVKNHSLWHALEIFRTSSQ